MVKTDTSFFLTIAARRAFILIFVRLWYRQNEEKDMTKRVILLLGEKTKLRQRQRQQQSQKRGTNTKRNKGDKAKDKQSKHNE